MSLPTATVEGRLQRQLLHRTAPTPHDSISTRSGATRFLTPLRDPQTWLDLLWILVHFIISMVTLSIALTWAVGETQRELGTLRTSRDAGRQAETDQLRCLERDIHDGPQQRLVRLNMDLARARRMAATDPVRMLTQREREVLELMAQGHSNARIAADLVVTEGAVEKHTQSDLRQARPAGRRRGAPKGVRRADAAAGSRVSESPGSSPASRRPG